LRVSNEPGKKKTSPDPKTSAIELFEMFVHLCRAWLKGYWFEGKKGSGGEPSPRPLQYDLPGRFGGCLVVYV
jgi:hypothetical protein